MDRAFDTARHDRGHTRHAPFARDRTSTSSPTNHRFDITAGFALYDVVQIMDPSFTLNSSQSERLRSNKSDRRSSAMVSGKAAADRKAMDEDEVTRDRDADDREVLDGERHAGVQSLVRMLIIPFVDGVAFSIHRSIARRARQATA